MPFCLSTFTHPLMLADFCILLYGSMGISHRSTYACMDDLGSLRRYGPWLISGFTLGGYPSGRDCSLLHQLAGGNSLS